MKIYHYDDSGVFIRESEAVRDPEEKAEKYLIPRNSTTLEPPPVLTGSVPVFHRATNTWFTVPDHRGLEYWDTEGKKHRILKAGLVPPPDAVLEGPPADFVRPKFIDGQWVETNIPESVKMGGLACVFNNRAAFEQAFRKAESIEELKAVLLDILFKGEGGGNNNAKEEKPTT